MTVALARGGADRRVSRHLSGAVRIESLEKNHGDVSQGKSVSEEMTEQSRPGE